MFNPAPINFLAYDQSSYRIDVQDDAPLFHVDRLTFVVAILV